ncbi:MAG: hypothetical protein GXZ15_02375 [Campylobacter sp.]|nr:hypothetical protein [Campylobacter sp.]
MNNTFEVILLIVLALGALCYLLYINFKKKDCGCKSSGSCPLSNKEKK